MVLAAGFFGGFGFGSFDSPSMALPSGIQSPSCQAMYSWKVSIPIRVIRATGRAGGMRKAPKRGRIATTDFTDDTDEKRLRAGKIDRSDLGLYSILPSVLSV